MHIGIQYKTSERTDVADFHKYYANMIMDLSTIEKFMAVFYAIEYIQWYNIYPYGRRIIMISKKKK